MQKKSRSIWFFYACILCLCYSQTTSLMAGILMWTTQTYLLVTALFVVFALLAVYLPVKLLACRFCFDPLSALGGWGRAVCAVLFFLLLSGYGLLHWQKGTAYPVIALLASAAIFYYASLSMLCSALVALVAVCVGVFLPGWFFAGTYQEWIVTALAGSLLLFFQAMFWFFERSGKRAAGWVLLFMGGAIGGVACSWDILLVCYPALFVSSLIRRKGRDNRFGARISCYLCALISAFLACLLFAALFSFRTDVSYGVQAALQQGLFRPVSRRLADLPVLPLWGYWVFLAVYLASFFNLFGRELKLSMAEENWLVPFIGVSVFNLAMGAGPAAQGDCMIFTGVLAGLGILQMFTSQLETKEQEETDMLEAQEGQEDFSTEGPAGSVEKEKPVAPQPGEMLSNPLPTPKKHTFREMDYAFTPPEDQMGYDLSVDPEDDFDL